MESLSHSIERAKKLVETFQKDYDCYIKCDMLEVFVLSNEIDKLIKQDQKNCIEDVEKIANFIKL